MTIVDKEYAYSCPFTTTYLHSEYVKKEAEKAGLITRANSAKILLDRFSMKFPVIRHFIGRRADPLKMMGSLEYKMKARITAIFILRRGASNHIEDAGKGDKTVWEILHCNRSEFYYFSDRLLLSYSYYHPEYNLSELMNREYLVIKSLVENTDCFILECRDPSDFPKMVRDKLGY